MKNIMDVLNKDTLKLINCKNSLSNSLSAIMEILIATGDPLTLEATSAFLADFKEFNDCIIDVLNKSNTRK
jgi:hypothetical protein